MLCSPAKTTVNERKMTETELTHAQEREAIEARLAAIQFADRSQSKMTDAERKNAVNVESQIGFSIEPLSEWVGGVNAQESEG